MPFITDDCRQIAHTGAALLVLIVLAWFGAAIWSAGL